MKEKADYSTDLAHDAIDALQELFQYNNTDSVIFSSLPGEPNPPLGNFLG